MARGRYNRRHVHGVLRKKFSLRQAKARSRKGVKRSGSLMGVRKPRKARTSTTSTRTPTSSASITATRARRRRRPGR